MEGGGVTDPTGLNSICAIRYRLLFHTGTSCTPLSAYHTCSILALTRPWWRFQLPVIRLSLSPQPIQSRLNLSLACWILGTRTSGDWMLGAEEKPPAHANLSMLFMPKLRPWPPPMDRPVSARLSRSDFTE